MGTGVTMTGGVGMGNFKLGTDQFSLAVVLVLILRPQGSKAGEFVGDNNTF